MIIKEETKTGKQTNIGGRKMFGDLILYEANSGIVLIISKISNYCSKFVYEIDQNVNRNLNEQHLKKLVILLQKHVRTAECRKLKVKRVH